MRPSSPVCGVTSFMPRMCSACDGGFVGRSGQLHAAGFAASACVNLRLHDDHGRSEPLRHGARFVLFEHDFAARHRNAELREDGLRLIFVNLHALSIGLFTFALLKRWER